MIDFTTVAMVSCVLSIIDIVLVVCAWKYPKFAELMCVGSRQVFTILVLYSVTPCFNIAPLVILIFRSFAVGIDYLQEKIKFPPHIRY